MSLLNKAFDACQYFVVKNIYGDHNKSSKVQGAILKLIGYMPNDFRGLNIGAGQTRVHKSIKNLELEPGLNIDYVGSVLAIPCNDNIFDVVLAQEVLEHVSAPGAAIDEINRVLKVGGYFYLQLPFIIGYHPCPKDFWRFTHEGIRELLPQDKFDIIDSDITVGPAVGFYRILIEFLALCFSLGISSLYKPTKLVFAVLFFPIKFLDPLLLRSKQANRIAGGYYVIGKKK
jgi:SAM-dependent methyltransferase